MTDDSSTSTKLPVSKLEATITFKTEKKQNYNYSMVSKSFRFEQMVCNSIQLRTLCRIRLKNILVLSEIVFCENVKLRII